MKLLQRAQTSDVRVSSNNGPKFLKLDFIYHAIDFV